MRNLTLAVVVGSLTVAAALPAAAAPGPGRVQHPWCVIYQDWGDGWGCAFDSFEQCLAEARAGNSGFCAANPFYQAPATSAPPRKRRKPR